MNKIIQVVSMVLVFGFGFVFANAYAGDDLQPYAEYREAESFTAEEPMEGQKSEEFGLQPYWSEGEFTEEAESFTAEEPMEELKSEEFGLQPYWSEGEFTGAESFTIEEPRSEEFLSPEYMGP